MSLASTSEIDFLLFLMGFTSQVICESESDPNTATSPNLYPGVATSPKLAHPDFVVARLEPGSNVDSLTR